MSDVSRNYDSYFVKLDGFLCYFKIVNTDPFALSFEAELVRDS